jgi:hypothetical protein
VATLRLPYAPRKMTSVHTRETAELAYPAAYQGIVTRMAIRTRGFHPASPAKTRTCPPIHTLVGGFCQHLVEQSKTRRSRLLRGTRQMGVDSESN